MIRYSDKLAQILPPSDPQKISRIKTDDPVMATQMDDQNNEGVIGTAEGSIKYIQFSEENQTAVKLV